MQKYQIKTTGLIVLTVVSAFLGGLAATYFLHPRPAFAQRPAYVQIQWEYQRVVIGDQYTYTGHTDKINKEFDKIVKEGWELVQVNEKSGTSDKIATYWRRPKALSNPSY